MSAARKLIPRGAGYLGFFVAVFLVSLYISFNPNDLAPLIESQVQALPYFSDKTVKLEGVSLYRFTGLDLKNITITAKDLDGAAPLTIDRLAIAPSFGTLLALRKGANPEAPPPLAVSFIIELGGGAVTGELETHDQAFSLLIETETPVSLDQLAIPSAKYRELKLEGKVSGTIKLESEDRTSPQTMGGEIRIDLDRPAIKKLTLMGAFTLEDLTMNKGSLIVTIKEGTGQVETLRFEGEDLPVSLTGTVAIKNPWPQTLVDLKGSIHPGAGFKSKNPTIPDVIPDTDKYAIQGPLETLVGAM